MKKVICIIWSLVLAITGTARGADNVFKVINPDYKLSPYTGMTRQHWIEADKYLLDMGDADLDYLEDKCRVLMEYLPKWESNGDVLDFAII